MQLQLVRSRNLLDHARKQLLRHVHQVLIVRVRHVKLAGRKLWVVRQINPFIAKLPPDLVHAIEAPHHQHLQVELWSNPHKQPHVQLVVVRNKRLGRRAACNHVHHGSLHFDKRPAVQKLPQIARDLGLGLENLPGMRVDDQIQIALAVARLLVFDSARSLGKHVQARRQNLDGSGKH